MQEKKKFKKLVHIKVYEQFFDSDYDDGGVAVATDFTAESEDYVVAAKNETYDYSVVFSNEEGEHVTLDLGRAIETISQDGTAEMYVVEDSASDGREYRATGKYTMEDHEFFGEIWKLESVLIEEI